MVTETGALGQGPQPHAQDLADKVSKVWATFARKGDPANPSKPTDSAGRRDAMIFNDTCQAAVDPDREARQLWSKVATV